MRIYFDHNATTPLHPAVLDAVTTTLPCDFGNASSVHAFGQRAKGLLDAARGTVHNEAVVRLLVTETPLGESHEQVLVGVVIVVIRRCDRTDAGWLR